MPNKPVGKIILRESAWLALCVGVSAVVLVSVSRLLNLDADWSYWWNHVFLVKSFRLHFVAGVGAIALYALVRLGMWLRSRGGWLETLWLAPPVLTMMVLMGFYVQSRFAMHESQDQQTLTSAGFPFEMYYSDRTPTGASRGWWEWSMIPANAAVYLAVFIVLIYPLLLRLRANRDERRRRYAGRRR